MRKMYQREWHGIPLEKVGRLTSKELPDQAFYSSFYRMFFDKYKTIQDIDPSWIELKMQAARFICQHNKFTKESRILSIGCGLGIMEKAIIDEGFSNLEVTEISMEPLRILLTCISHDHVHIGLFPDCIPDNRFYDFILLSSVDYFLDKKELTCFLNAVRERLSSNGVCLLISWSIEPSALTGKISGTIKNIAAFFLEKLNLRSRGQFWGYLRTRDEYKCAMLNSGFLNVCEGFLEKKTQWDTYWVKGSKN